MCAEDSVIMREEVLVVDVFQMRGSAAPWKSSLYALRILATEPSLLGRGKGRGRHTSGCSAIVVHAIELRPQHIRLQQHNLRIHLPQRQQSVAAPTSHCSRLQPTLAHTSSFACLADCSSAWVLQQRSRSASRLCCDADSAASTSCSLQEIPTEQRLVS